ncbi:UNVERIFIED_CONTAM: hypothetical protein Sindi_0200100 [Sesamum indicum]
MSSFGEVDVGSRPSQTWQGIRGLKQVLIQGCWQDKEGTWKWHFEQSGRFSVKSAYRQVVAMRGRDMTSSSHSNLHLTRGRRSLWMVLWRVEAPPKVRLFMWKMCMEALTDIERLASQVKGIDAACVVCGVPVEINKTCILGLPVCKTDMGNIKHSMEKYVKLVWRTSRMDFTCGSTIGQRAAEMVLYLMLGTLDASVLEADGK